MLDNDNLTYSYQKRVVADASSSKQAERTMITLERSQKLDLLIHLLANLRQALIVCGPEGIGKTTLLKAMETSRKDQWQICLLQGSSALSFETIIVSLNRFLNLGGPSAGFDLSSLRTYCEKQKVVLIIDDAGELVPGLIGELADFADSLSGLRLVFSMTHDEFHIKSASDKAVEDCHLIDLPPLSLKQCTEYLQNLSAQPGAIVSFNAVTDSLVGELYRETHGIPGKILAEIPKLASYQKRQKSRWGLWLGVAVIIVAAGWTMTVLLPSAPTGDAGSGKVPATVEHIAVPPVAVPNIPAVETVLPAMESLVRENAANQTPVPLPEQEALKPGPLAEPVPSPAATSSPAATKAVEQAEKVVVPAPSPPVLQTSQSPTTPALAPAQPPAEPIAPANGVAVPLADGQTENPQQQPTQPAKKAAEAKPVKTAMGASNLDWIMAQPPGNYTLQIMVLSNKAAADRFLKKYADYSDGLTYYAINSNDQEKYVLIYGSFKTAAEAQQLKAVMPGEFKQALEKRFRAVQKESRR
jgi:DamX protein